MPFEFLVVLYPTERRVKINDEFMGRTNTLLELEKGEYDVTLGPPINFKPESQRVDLRNTAAMTPMIVSFSPDVSG